MTVVSVDTVTGEIVDEHGDLTATEARDLTDRIRQTLTISHDLITAACLGRAWAALGYDSWDAYCTGEFAEARMVRLDRDQRREIVAEMDAAGMSTRAIASGLGVARNTVKDDLRSQVDQIDPPAPTPIQGMDGKTYQRPPAPEKRSRPALAPQARDAGWALRKAVERLARIGSDDRFASNKEMAPHLRGHLLNAIEVCQDLLDRINTEPEENTND